MADQRPIDLASTSPAEPVHEHQDVRFERTDLNLRGIVIVVSACCCWLAVQQFLTRKLFDRDLRREPEAHEAGFSTVTTPPSLPRGPRLEQVDRLAGDRNPNVFLRERDEERWLNGYGPSGEQGFVHVPIHWAIEQAAGQIEGRHAEPPGPVHDRGLVDAGEPNSGRVFRGGER